MPGRTDESQRGLIDAAGRCLSRRGFLRYSFAGLAAAGYSGWMGALAARAAEAGSAGGGVTGASKTSPKHCILIWLSGGPSHIDTFDPKTVGSDRMRSPFEPIKTSVPGTHFTSLLPNLAKQAHRLAVVRSMTSVEVEHALASFHVHTGYRQTSGPVEYPGIGAVVAKRLGAADAALPPYVYLRNQQISNGTGSGMLGPDWQPLYVVGDGTVANASSPLPPEEFAARVELLTKLNDRYVESHQGRAAVDQARTLARSIRLMTSTKLDAFDVSKETAQVREAYGNSAVGRSCLRARRLVEAGVPFIEVYCDEWDTHGDLQRNLPPTAFAFDRAASALIDDLRERGLYDQTLIVMLGEFGRSPKINPGGGRDHYAKAWSAALAGCGVAGGALVGKTDPTGAEVVDRPVKVPNLLATVYTLIGIDPTKPLPTPTGRPVTIVDSQGGDPAPVKELMG